MHRTSMPYLRSSSTSVSGNTLQCILTIVQTCKCCHPMHRYVLAYIESRGGVKRGERVWQLSFGSGFKCNSAVWVANRRIRDAHVAWQGFDVAKMYEDLAAMDAGQGLAAKQ